MLSSQRFPLGGTSLFTSIPRKNSSEAELTVMQFPTIGAGFGSPDSCLSSDSEETKSPSHPLASVHAELEKAKPQIMSKDPIYRLKNLSTGAEIDLRDEAKSNFGRLFARVIERTDQTAKYQRLL